MSKFVWSFSVILIGLAAGYIFNRLVDRGIVPLRADSSERLRLALQRFVLLAVNPVILPLLG